MMEHLSDGTIEGDGRSWDSLKWNLDITRYTAQPNLVNSTNNHIGITYCVKPKVDEEEKKKEKEKDFENYDFNALAA